MKFIAIITGILAVLLLMAGGAHALTFTDTTEFYRDHADPGVDLDSYGGNLVNKLEFFGDHLAWTHHFEFVPPAAEVFDGTLTLWLRDDRDRRRFEFGFGFTEDGTWDFGEVDTGQYSYNVSASALADGAFSVAVLSVGGDFFVDMSELEINYEPVPEPGTWILLGVGLAGLAGIRRKLRK